MRRFASVATGLFAALAGCGDDDGTRRLADAPPAEDGPQPDTPVPVTTVNVTAYARFYEGLTAMAPRQGATVYAFGPTNALVATVTTDAAGNASVELPDGGSVTIEYPHVMQGVQQYRSWVTTYAGVKPGDHLVVGDSFSFGPATNPSAGTFRVEFPVVANATHYYLFTPCSRGDFYSQPASASIIQADVDLYESCAAAMAPLALVAYQGGEIISSLFLAATPYTDVSANNDLTLTAGQWVAQAATPNFTATLTGLATGATISWLGGWGTFDGFTATQTTGATVDNGVATAMVSVPATAVRTILDARVQHDPASGRQYFYKSGASPVSVDTSTLPLIQSVTVDETARTVSWTVVAGTHDTTMVQFRWSYLDGDDSHQMTWTAILPPGVTELDASTLPAELAQLLPPATDFNLMNVHLVDLASAANYDEARAIPEWNLSYPHVGVTTGALPAAAIADGGEGSDFWQPYNPPF